ncbi:Protein of unknown function, partial [Cotesia congregata]
MKIIITKH